MQWNCVLHGEGLCVFEAAVVETIYSSFGKSLDMSTVQISIQSSACKTES